MHSLSGCPNKQAVQVCANKRHHTQLQPTSYPAGWPTQQLRFYRRPVPTGCTDLETQPPAGGGTINPRKRVGQHDGAARGRAGSGLRYECWPGHALNAPHAVCRPGSGTNEQSSLLIQQC